MSDKLKKLGFEQGRTIETIFLTKTDQGINHAPIGVERLGKELLGARIYKDTKTLKNLKKNPQFSANLTNESELFYKSVFDMQLNIHDFKLIDSFFTIKGNCLELNKKENYFNAKLLIKKMHKNKKTRGGYCRANSAIIEALIYFTKSPHKNKQLIEEKINKANEIVQKTGGEKEKKLIQKIKSKI